MNNYKKCRTCGSKLKNRLLSLPDMPGAVQNLPKNKDVALSTGVSLDVRQCSYCGLVQLTNDPVSYYKDVIRAGSISPSMRARQYNEFKLFIERFSLQGKNILEIGSGRGEYLSILNELPVTACGMEHNLDFNKMANDSGFKTYQAYPTELEKLPDGSLFDAFISINFLEHAPDPNDFLRHSADFLTEDGVGMIAVPDFEFELKDNFLFSFMSDHLLYFTADSLRSTINHNGFEVVELFRNEKLNVVTAYFNKRKLLDISLSKKKYDDLNTNINSFLDSILENGGKIAVWGASHLAFSIISASKIKNKISYIVDSAPFKQNKYSPASGLEIFPPNYLAEDPVDSIIIMCPEYSTEIVAGIKENFSHIVRNIATFKNGEIQLVQ
jgi:2-polyprenyl-3-methyl-5-hydroxy-6-metoxy-1,4-benzoquinol methylase